MRWFNRLVLLLSLASPSFAAEPAEGPTWRVAPPAAPQLDALPDEPAEWTVVDGLYARVHGPAHRTDLLLRVANHAAVSLPALAERLGVPIGDTVHIYVVSSMDEFRQLQPGTPPTWADATAYPELGAVFLRAPELRPGTEDPLETVIDHELVHILLGRAFAPADPPRWLQEGVAQVYAGEFGPEDARTLTGAPVMSLGQLHNGFPREAGQARLAYVLSADFVAWLGYEYGDSAVPTLIRAMAREQDIGDAVHVATGMPIAEVEQAWRDRLADGPPAWLRWVEDGRLAFGFGALALIGGGILRRRRFHQRMTEREAEEALEEQRRREQTWDRVHAHGGSAGGWQGVAY